VALLYYKKHKLQKKTAGLKIKARRCMVCGSLDCRGGTSLGQHGFTSLAHAKLSLGSCTSGSVQVSETAAVDLASARPTIGCGLKPVRVV